MVRCAALLLAFGLLLSTPVRGQWLDPDTCWTCGDKLGHAAGGAVLALVIRGPWVARPWRDTWWKRMAWVVGLGCVLYESYHVYEDNKYGRLGQRGFGFGALDCAAVAAGALTLELVTVTWHTLRR